MLIFQRQDHDVTAFEVRCHFVQEKMNRSTDVKAQINRGHSQCLFDPLRVYSKEGAGSGCKDKFVLVLVPCEQLVLHHLRIIDPVLSGY